MARTKISVRIDGIKETIAELSLRDKRVEKAVKAQVGESALKIQEGAKERAPVDTGALRNSITVDFYERGLAAQIGPHMPYAPYVEYGTRKMAARPYLGPAFAAERPNFERGIKKVLKGAIE